MVSRLVFGLGLWMTPAISAGAPDTRVLIEQALDEPTQITLENIKLGDAIDRLTEQTGVRIVMPPEAIALVPYGASTIILKVEIANVPLRQGLTQLFDPLGMTFEIRDDHVAVIPKETILCLGRAPSWAELDLLARLGAIRFGGEADALNDLRPLVQFQVNAPDPWSALAEAIRSVGAGTADQVLTIACNNLGWSWCPSHDRVAVTTLEQQIRRQLQQTITMRIGNRPLFDVLDQVSKAIHVSIRLEAGVPLPKNFSFNISNATAERVLDRIAAEAGLTYLVEAEGVVFYSVNGDARPPSGDQPDPWFCKIVVPLEDGKSIEFPIRESEVPVDVRAFREQAKNRVFEMLRQSSNQP